MHAGGRAEMHYARSAIPWRSDLQQRGLFTQHSGRWRSDRGSTLELPAHCLLWCELAAAETWHFTAAAAAAPASALWLGFTPD